MPNIEYEVDGTIYEFPEGMPAEEVTAVLRRQKIIPGGDFDDVQSGTSAPDPVESYRERLAKYGPQAVESMDRDISAEGKAGLETLKGIGQGVRNLGRVGREITGVGPLARAAGVEIPDDPAFLQNDPGHEMGGTIGRSAVASVMPGGLILGGAGGGAAMTGTPEGAAAGAAAGGVMKLGGAAAGKALEIARALRNPAYRGAVGAEAARAVPAWLKDAVRAGKLAANPDEAINLANARRTMIEAGEEQFAREAIAAAERKAQEPLARSMAKDAEGADVAALRAKIEDKARTHAAEQEARRLQAEAKAEGDSILKASADRRAAAERAHQEARGASLAAEERQHGRAIVEENSRARRAEAGARDAGEARAEDFEDELEEGIAEARARTKPEAPPAKPNKSPKQEKQAAFDEKVDASRAGGVDLGSLAGLEPKAQEAFVSASKAVAAGNMAGARAALERFNRLSGLKIDLKSLMKKGGAK